MGRRSRKRSVGAGADSARDDAGGSERSGATRSKRDASSRQPETRAERDAARRVQRAERDAAARDQRTTPSRASSASRRASTRPSAADRPPAPWGSFPLSELVILLGIVVLAWGVLSGKGGGERIVAGLVLASLGGGELALREHLAGFRSHSALLAGVTAFAVITVVALALGPVKLWLLLLIGVAVFGSAFYALRELFKQRSGGLGFR